MYIYIYISYILIMVTFIMQRVWKILVVFAYTLNCSQNAPFIKRTIIKEKLRAPVSYSLWMRVSSGSVSYLISRDAFRARRPDFAKVARFSLSIGPSFFKKHSRRYMYIHYLAICITHSQNERATCVNGRMNRESRHIVILRENEQRNTSLSYSGAKRERTKPVGGCRIQYGKRMTLKMKTRAPQNNTILNVKMYTLIR